MEEKILKAKYKKEGTLIFDIKKITFIERMTPLQALLDGEEMLYPIKVIKHLPQENIRYGANGTKYVEKEFSVWEGSQRIKAAIQLGYTHIEGIIINE